MRAVPPFTALLISGLALACGPGSEPQAAADAGYDCSQDDRGETFTAGMTRSGEAGYTFRLDDARPEPPGKNDNRWTVALTSPSGAPVTGLEITPRLCMPDHHHGTQVIPTVTSGGDGSFVIDRLNLWMPGLWEIQLLVRDADSGDLPPTCQPVAAAQRLDEVTFRFCVDG
jgi:hypothetical protein